MKRERMWLSPANCWNCAFQPKNCKKIRKIGNLGFHLLKIGIFLFNWCWALGSVIIQNLITNVRKIFPNLPWSCSMANAVHLFCSSFHAFMECCVSCKHWNECHSEPRVQIINIYPSFTEAFLTFVPLISFGFMNLHPSVTQAHIKGRKSEINSISYVCQCKNK